MEIEKLIGRLKYYSTTYAIGDNLGREIQGTGELMFDTADALSTLQAENAQLRDELEREKQFTACYEHLTDMGLEVSKKLLANLEKLKSERDAAKKDLETIMFVGGQNTDTCEYCRNAQCYGRNGTQLCNPEWRGPEEE